jgi:death-on-curing protein
MILKQFGNDERAVDEAETVAYLESHTVEHDLAEEIEQWREDLIQFGLSELTGESRDPND